MSRGLSEFVSDIHSSSGELLDGLRLGVLPDLEDWNTFVNLFNAAQLLWWSQYRQTAAATSSPSP
jgi:hypothetical protein